MNLFPKRFSGSHRLTELVGAIGIEARDYREGLREHGGLRVRDQRFDPAQPRQPDFLLLVREVGCQRFDHGGRVFCEARALCRVFTV